MNRIREYVVRIRKKNEYRIREYVFRIRKYKDDIESSDQMCFSSDIMEHS